MEIKDVIKQTATILQLSNVVDANLDNFNNLDAQTKKDVNLLISCINEVLCDIATDYLPLKTTEQIVVSDGEFDLATLSKTFHKVVSIDTSNSYKIEHDCLKIKDGTYQIEYSYLPSIYELQDEITDFDSRLTIHALCFGVAGEFCIVSGNYAESEMWNSRFESAMQVAKRSLKIGELSKRRWI
jgi:hypothetical protein